VATDADFTRVEAPSLRDVRAAWRVSLLSIAWTLVASTFAVVLGLGHSAGLVAFGAVGYVDAIGSVALAYHFWHCMRHDAPNEGVEKLAHALVSLGLISVGVGAVVVGVTRLLTGQVGEGSTPGIVLAGLSCVALAALAARKRRVAGLVSSAALRADGHLSGIGAMQAAVVLAGVATSAWLALGWVDSAAAAVLGVLAIGLGRASFRDSRQRSAARRRRPVHRSPEFKADMCAPKG
jgi:divalent metal cation (Fe/Co/Zn/Cd) transporter